MSSEIASPITEKVLDESKEIKYIYHSADIHIPNRIDRHDEYRYVFKNLFMFLEQQNEKDKSILVICGDIVDSKTILSPECISMVVKFLKKLQKIMPVIMILGNHDVNMSNSDRMDALTPIVEHSNIFRKVFLLKNTGAYHHGNITFGVTSVYDKKIFPANQIVNRRQYVIGLCHKTIQGATIDSGRVMQSEVKEGFNGYYLMLMGDIHKHQYIRSEGTLCCYSGSLIQQNFGESLDGHGIVKWTLGENPTPEFIPILNEYGFCTFDGKVDEEKLPRYPKIRIQNMDKKQAREIENHLREKYDVKLFHADPPINKEGDFDITADDETMLRNYLGECKYADEIVKIHNVVKKSVDMDSIKQAREKIFIKELKWRNMISYGGNIENSIYFTQYEGKTVGIFARNELGKTSLIDILTYALFGVYSRGSNLEIINWNEKEYECSITFSKGNADYVITRKGKKTDSVTLVRVVNGIENNMNEKDKKGTEKEIEILVGDIEDYKNTCIITADNEGNFVKMTSDGRMKMLRRILRVDNYDIFCKVSTSKREDLRRKKLNTEEKMYRNNEEIKSMLVEETKRNIDDITGEINTIDVEIKKYEDEENNLRKGIKEYKILREKSTVEKEKIKANKQLNVLSQNLYVREDICSKIDSLCKNHKYDETYKLQMKAKHEEFEKIKKKNTDVLDEKINENTRKIAEETEIDEKSVRDKGEEIKKLLKLLDVDGSEVTTEQIDGMITNLQSLVVGVNKSEILTEEKIDSIRKRIIDIERKIPKDEKLDIDEIKKEKIKKMNLLAELQRLNKEIELRRSQINSLKRPISVFEECSFAPECTRCTENKERLNKWKKDNGVINMETEIGTFIAQLDGLGNIEELKAIIDTLEKRENSLIFSLRMNTEKNNLSEQIVRHETGKKILSKNIKIKNDISKLHEKRKILIDMKENERQMREVVKNNQIKKQNEEVEKKITELQMEKKSISDTKDEEYDNYVYNLGEFDKLTKILRDIELNEERIKNITNVLKDIDKELKEIKMNEEVLVSNTKITDQIQNIENVKGEMKKKRDEFIIKKTNLEAKVRNANRILDENKLLLSQCNELEDEITNYDKYITAVGKKGIPFSIIKKAVNKIQSEVNTFLVQCGVEYTISVECEEKALRVLISDKNRDIKAVSGEQKFLISTAFRSVFSELSTIVKTNFMWIDEGISSLDDFHINHIRNMFDILKENYIVFVMSHLSHIQDAVDDRINISSEDGYSYLTKPE
jgi:DNA repair exonuclease SbcCD ATPase subunit/DNA repair exonuclease SbcCD nuclease subunit